MPNMIKLEAQPDEIYDIELEHSLLEANEKLARQNRALLDQHGATAIEINPAETDFSRDVTFTLRGPSAEILPRLIT